MKGRTKETRLGTRLSPEISRILKSRDGFISALPLIWTLKKNTNRIAFTCCTQRYARNREMNFGSENEYQWNIQETESTMGCGINIFFHL